MCAQKGDLSRGGAQCNRERTRRESGSYRLIKKEEEEEEETAKTSGTRQQYACLYLLDLQQLSGCCRLQLDRLAL